MNYWPSTYLGDFFSGYKVFYERLGAVEVKNLLRAVPLDALVSYHIYILESQEREYVQSVDASNLAKTSFRTNSVFSAFPPLTCCFYYRLDVVVNSNNEDTPYLLSTFKIVTD